MEDKIKQEDIHDSLDRLEAITASWQGMLDESIQKMNDYKQKKLVDVSLSRGLIAFFVAASLLDTVLLSISLYIHLIEWKNLLLH